MQYSADYDDTMIGYRMQVSGLNLNPYASDPAVQSSAKTPIFFNQLLQPYTKSDQIFVCPSNPVAFTNVDKITGQADAFQSYGGQNSYGGNNYLFKGIQGPPLTVVEPSKMSAFPEAASTVMIVDARYYNVLPKTPNAPSGLPCRLIGDTGTPPYTPSSSHQQYWKNLGNSYNFSYTGYVPPTDAEAEVRGKARHMETLNVLWLDGHVKAMPYSRIAIDSDLKVGSTNSVWDPFKQGCA